MPAADVAWGDTLADDVAGDVACARWQVMWRLPCVLHWPYHMDHFKLRHVSATETFFRHKTCPFSSWKTFLSSQKAPKNVTVFGLLSSQKYNSSDHIQLRSHTAQITQQVIELTS